MLSLQRNYGCVRNKALKMDTSRETFLLRFNKILEEFFAGYPPKLVERTKQMIDYMIPNYNKTIA